MNMLKAFAAAALATTVAFAGPPAVPATPSPVKDIVYARSFTVEQGEINYWRAEKPEIVSGYIIVIEVNPDLVYPRQSAEPVLYVGDQTAQRLNVGYESGFVVALVPGELEGDSKLDLTTAPIWFGTPELPERVDADRIRQEKALAVNVGIKPFDAEKIEKVLAEGGETMAEETLAGVLEVVADLVDEYSPQEADLAAGLRGSAQPAGN